MSVCSTSKHGNDEVENKREYGNANEDEDDDDDVDFNPFLNETHYAEASSSLNSEVEDLDTDADDTEEKSFLSFPRNLKENNTNITAAGVEGGEKIMMQTNILATFTERESILASEAEDGSLRNEDMDTEDAICMRTRARYSLTSFTLDELEIFLQETDDEDDLQNIDDEAEYKKFLAAVLLCDDSRKLEGNANGDDEEDEENDADFDLELEEALESDPDGTEERRMTWRNRRHEASDTRSKKNSEQLNRPLRPLLPFVPIGSFSAFMENQTTLTTTQYQPPPHKGFTSGFSAHQIGQLHCLIHEHVQLLIQVFAVCVLDPAKGDIAVEIKNLLLEILQKRDQVLEWRRHPFPRFCFFPPYTHPSVADDLYSHKSWVPDFSGPVLSVTDVAPLRLVINFIDDVSSAVGAYRRNQIELGLVTCEKEPLFPFHNPLVSTESDGQEIITSPQDSGEVLSSLSIIQISKKTMAASLIEKSKKQPVALVPKEIAQLAQRFCQLFNPALYPRKPPPAPIANRVLFTDAEDELLALGLMEYNTDWKAIQQRFLPCKSSHQIFVRQKNRVSSKAPENPIKAVRRLKNSPLTSEEIARIDVGLKNYKLDWISIWRFFVPYRDPSLLPRQWRIACGTQKSYKSDANNKAKRRLNDLRRKAKKPLSTCHSSDKEGDSTDNAVDGTYNGGIQADKGNGAYVHEAFLVDWRSDSNAALNCTATHLSSQKDPQPQMCFKDPASTMLPYRTRKPKYARLVKLAPDLPPINLPPSVRVMPQSDFSKSRGIPLSAKIPCNVLRNGRMLAENGAPQVGSTKQPENDQSAKSGQSGVGDQYKKSVEVLSDKRVTVQSSYSDFQMHPLLFESPQVGCLPYYSLESNTNTVSEKHPPRLNLSLFHNPRQIRDAVNFLSNSSRPAERHLSSSSSAAAAADIVFHPLLHDMNKESTHPSNSSLSCPITSKPSRNSTKISSHSGKVNVDLDIGLNFNSNKQDADVENRKMISHCAGRLLQGKGSASDGTGNNMYSDSLPRIIMEQEELSDSDDEEFGNNNNVEFEHEEMADSEEDVTSNFNTPDEEMEIDEISNERCTVNEPRVLSLNLNSYPPVSPLVNTNCSATPKKFDFELFGATAGNNNVIEHSSDSNLQLKSRKWERPRANENVQYY